MKTRRLTPGAMSVALTLVGLSTAKAQLFTDVAPDLGLSDVGICAEFFAYDWDNDGDQDLLLTRRFGSEVILYQNEGGEFTRMTDMGLPVFSDGGRPRPMDFDHDGDVDMALGCYSTPSPLLVNEGGIFVDRTAELGLPLITGERDYTWVDFNHDGWMDLLKGHSQEGFRLFENQSGQSFLNVTGQSQLPPYSDFMEVAEADMDLDGDVDLFMTRLNHDDHLFANQGNGTFVDVTQAAGLGDAVGNDDCAWVDFDNDKFPDLLTQGPDRHAIWHNNGNGTFTEMNVHGTGVSDWGDYPYGAQYAIADFDMDGDQDFYVGRPGGCGDGLAPNQMFIQESRNGMDIWFTDMAPVWGMDFEADCTPHVVDFDGDGDMDLLIAPHNEAVKLFRNNTNQATSFQVSVRGPNGERDRWHTRVEVYPHGSNDVVATSELNYSNVNRNGLNNYFVTDPDGHYDLRLYFACGVTMFPEDYPQLSDVVPSQINRLLTVYMGEQASSTPEPVVPRSFGLTGAYPNPFNAVTEIRYELSEPADVKLSVYSVDGRRVADLVNQPISAGQHYATWSAGESGSGIYLVHFTAGHRHATSKVVLLK